MTGHGHIDNIMVFQVDLRRAAGPFQDQQIEFGRQRIIGCGNRLPGFGLIGHIFVHVHIGDRPAVDDDLAAHIAGRFEQDRIHPDIGVESAGLGLHHLGPAHL